MWITLNKVIHKSIKLSMASQLNHKNLTTFPHKDNKFNNLATFMIKTHCNNHNPKGEKHLLFNPFPSSNRLNRLQQ